MPNQIKRTTSKRLKVRGVENMMWAVIGTILVVVVALVMWHIFTSSASTIEAPQVQLVPHESFVIGNSANVTLKFGRGFSNVRVSLLASDGTTMRTIATCSPLGYNVAEGQKVSFRCDNLASTPGIIYVRVVWNGGSTTIKWVVG
jgi:ABC-type glycerol-3-phosphate transport system permease component